jgi:hypothetical protein
MQGQKAQLKAHELICQKEKEKKAHEVVPGKLHSII